MRAADAPDSDDVIQTDVVIVGEGLWVWGSP